jgi:ribosome-interacting GTPase 1
MPANLTPEFKRAEEIYRQARSDEEKLKALELMLTTIPKHKGTDRMQGDIKRRMSKLKKDAVKKKGSSRQAGLEYHVEKQGAAQVTLVGLGNCGKSSIVGAVSNAEVVIADYPASTIKAVPAMMDFEDIQIQLVDIPPVDYEPTGKWVANVIRYTDMLAFVLDLADEPMIQYELILEQLSGWRIKILKNDETPPKLTGDWHLPAIIIGTKLDLPESEKYLEEVREALCKDFTVTACTVGEQLYIEEMKRDIFKALKLVRVYSKVPGKEADLSAPFILSEGSSLLEFAEKVHKDFYKKLNYARIWGSELYNGQRASRGYILHDRDIVELHM